MQIECEGWWVQDYLGKQAMDPLVLEFQEGNINGTGHDVVGHFTMMGTLREGNVVIDKYYLGQHSAKYVGQFDGEGNMQGTWHIGELSGPWAIHLRGKANAGGSTQHEIRDIS